MASAWRGQRRTAASTRERSVSGGHSMRSRTRSSSPTRNTSGAIFMQTALPSQRSWSTTTRTSGVSLRTDRQVKRRRPGRPTSRRDSAACRPRPRGRRRGACPRATQKASLLSERPPRGETELGHREEELVAPAQLALFFRSRRRPRIDGALRLRGSYPSSATPIRKRTA